MLSLQSRGEVCTAAPHLVLGSSAALHRSWEQRWLGEVLHVGAVRAGSRLLAGRRQRAVRGAVTNAGLHRGHPCRALGTLRDDGCTGSVVLCPCHRHN